MKKYLIIAVLAAIGIFNAFYLSYEGLQILEAQKSAWPLGVLPCDISEKLSCSGILAHPRAVIFSIWEWKILFPMIAAVVYPLLFIIALWGWFSRSLLPAKILTVMAIGGIMFNSYVIYQEYVVQIFCPLCAMCTVIIVTIGILAGYMWKKGLQKS